MAHDSLNPENDPFAPPAISTEVHCIHCGEEYDSYRIEWRTERDADGAVHGFWCCPMESCDGKGFGFDIFPVDPEYRDENGELMWCSDSDEFDGDDYDDVEFFDDDSELSASEVSQGDAVEVGGDDEGAAAEWLVDEDAPSSSARPERD
jgi:hypothetical protein